MDGQTENLIQLAVKAGFAVMHIYEQESFWVKLKADQSPLTRADLASNQIIVEGLQQLTPGLPILSEESKTTPYETRKDWDLYWLIDPLDGTKEFLDRRGEFTINIALIENGSPRLGVVHAPVPGVTYFAEKGKGAFKRTLKEEPVPIKVSDYHKSKLRIVISRSHTGDKLESFLEKIKNFECVSIGSSLKLCLVAEGTAHLYPRLSPTMEWDTAAAQCVVEEAGGTVTDLPKQVLKYNKPDLLNPSFMVCGYPAFPWWDYL